MVCVRMLQIGEVITLSLVGGVSETGPAPSWVCVTQDGFNHSLSSLRGRSVRNGARRGVFH
ncbi:hypothetical protein GCM10028773_30490 [Spirosoma koreense]